MFAFGEDVIPGIRHTKEHAGAVVAAERAGNLHISREGIAAGRQRVGILINAVEAVCLSGVTHPAGLFAEFGIGFTGVIAGGKSIAVGRHTRPVVQIFKVVAGEQVVDIAYNACSALAGMRMNTAFLALGAGVAGILRIYVLAQDIAVVVKSIHRLQDIVRALAFRRILRLDRLNRCLTGSRGILIGGLCAHEKVTVFRAVFGHRGQAAAGVGISNLICGFIGNQQLGGNAGVTVYAKAWVFVSITRI